MRRSPVWPCPMCGANKHAGKGCPKRPRASGKRKPREIVSFDCETNSRGVVLFLQSGETQNQRSYVYNADGLELEEILRWMIIEGHGKLAFGFYFDYDVNQLIRQLPEPHIRQLASTGRVTWRGFRIRHIPGKRFQVRYGKHSVVVWDCASWAQCSFLRVCQEWRLGTEQERELVARMKAKRGDFDDATETELVEYTTLECALLSQWVRRLLELHEECDIALRAYSGPGSTASAMIRAEGWKPPEVPERIQEIAELAFFGGRTEISCIGPVDGPIYSYDINSAYPSAIADLPEIRDVKWKRVKKWISGGWGFYRVRWQQRKTDCWGMFPIRGALLPDGKRSISLLYPTEGDGWFHSSEVGNALDLIGYSRIEIVDGWVIEPKGEPFAWVREMAARRLEYKARGDERAYPLKVGLNSVYGKLAQHSGDHPLQCLTYAAAVTATTRAALLRASYQHQHNVILMATDGILSRVPLNVRGGAGLGEWESCEYDNAWMLQAGVYWAGSKKRTRGIDARTLELDAVDALWRRGGTGAVISLPSRRVLSYRLCCAQNKPDQTGTWYDGQRQVRFSPTPRRRSWKREAARMLTIPARVADYQRQAMIDALCIGIDPSAKFDEHEALPDWAMPD